MRLPFHLALLCALVGFLWADAAAQDGREHATEQPVSGRLSLTVWAKTGFLKNPTALSFDRDGRCYVAQTMRREGGELEAESDPGARLIPDHAFRSVEEKFRWAGDGDPAWASRPGGKKETITRLEDSHHTGAADTTTTFYEGFDVNGSDTLAGVLWHDGNVYATLAPNLWLLNDTKKLGHADRVKSLSFGYAVHMGTKGHNMHGLTVGPDGKIYFTMSDKGVNVTTREGRHLVYPDCGTCLRCNPDGSDLEVFAYGLRNTFEVAFDKYGNLFGVDNDGDFPGERERAVYIVEGGDSGWRYQWQWRGKAFDVGEPPERRRDRYDPWLAERLWVPYFSGQAAYITPPLANYTDGPAGFKYATEGSLNERYAGAFFVDEFPKATIRAFRVKPKGASFALYGDEIVSRGVQCTGLALGPDGALYGAEWGKTAFKLGNTGSVVKLDDPVAANSSLRVETHKLLSKGPGGKSDEELLALLGHADMRVRLDAQFELVKRNRQQILFGAAFPSAQPQTARIHALWGLGQLVSSKAMDRAGIDRLAQRLPKAFADADPEIRAQSLKLSGEIAAKYGPSRDNTPVIECLKDASSRVRFFAAIALGKMKDRGAFQPLIRLAAENRPLDPYLRHAIVMGLAGIGDADALATLVKHPSAEVRVIAVVALRRLRSPVVAAFLPDRDEFVATEAARAIYDDESIPVALPALAEAAERAGITNEAFLRRALNANQLIGGAAQVERLVRYAVNEANPPAMRLEALEILGSWTNPAANDRVGGSYRTRPSRSGFSVKAAIADQTAALLGSENQDVAQAAARLIDSLGIETNDVVYTAWVADGTRAVGPRVTALRLLARRKHVGLAKSIEEALGSGQPLLRIEAVRLLAEQDPARAMTVVAEMLDRGSLVERQAALRLLGALHDPKAAAELERRVDELVHGNVPADVQLDVIEAAESSGNRELIQRFKQWKAETTAKDPLAAHYPELAGGDTERGKAVFTSHPQAACVRCHTTDSAGSGSSVGPSLAGIGAKPDKPPRYLLESLIDPNAYVVPGYGTASFTLTDGTEIAAAVKSETADAVELLDLEGNATRLEKSSVASRTPAVSMMPAMGAILTRDEIRDVIAYLESLR